MDLVTSALSWIFLLGGAFFMVTGGVGVLRLPDVFTRLHAAGLKDTLGASLTLVGLMFQAGLSLITVKLLLIWAFLWFTAPVASHAVARAALLGGVRPILAKQARREEGDRVAEEIGASAHIEGNGTARRGTA